MSAEPRFETILDPGADTWYPYLADVAEALGTPLMPWQERVGRLIAAHVDGKPRYETVVVTVPRQQGKTALAHAFLTAVAERNHDYRLYATAQTRLDAARHLENLGLKLGDDVQTRLSVGSERLTWDNGSMLQIISPTQGGGHGASIDALLLDEVWAIHPHVMGGVIPARAARPNSQMLAISTMGTVDSTVLNGLVAKGRDSIDDPDSSIAYIEYSAPDDAAVFDEDLWETWMPAFGHTVSIEAIRSARDTLEPFEFIRAFGNRVTQTMVRVFPEDWIEGAWRVIDPPQSFVLAVDVNDEPPGASIATAHMTTEDKVAVRVVQWQWGAERWLPAVVEQMVKRREVEAIVGDFGGPARAVMSELTNIAEAAFIPIIDRKPRDLAADTARFYDALRPEQKHVILEKSEPLSEAIVGAHRKTIGDMWLISRNAMNVDASPLIAAILAYGGAVELAISPPAEWAIF